jgi:outer membrane immunogenic protein
MYRVVSVSVGLVALVLPAAAADVRVRNTAAPASVFVAPVTNWSGFYLGAHIGGGDTSSNIDGDGGGGFLGGLQAGYNYQINQLVFGVEGEISWTSMGRSVTVGAINSTDIDWFATITGRLGYAFGNALVYGKLGVAFLDWSSNVAVSGPNRVVTAGNTDAGWVIGAGLEYAFTPSWSAKIEYNFLTFELDRTAFGNSTFDRDLDVHVFKVGVNYRFGWPATTAVRRY